MQCLEVSGAVRPFYGSLGVKRLTLTTSHNTARFYQNPEHSFPAVHIYGHKNLQALVRYCWLLSFSVIRRHRDLYIGGDAAVGLAASSFKGDYQYTNLHGVAYVVKATAVETPHRIVTLFFSKSGELFSNLLNIISTSSGSRHVGTCSLNPLAPELFNFSTPCI